MTVRIAFAVSLIDDPFSYSRWMTAIASRCVVRLISVICPDPFSSAFDA